MSALDRVMRAYTRKYPLTRDQSVLVRRELSRIIADLSKRPRGAPAMLPEGADDARPAALRTGSETVDAAAPAVRVATGRT